MRKIILPALMVLICSSFCIGCTAPKASMQTESNKVEKTTDETFEVKVLSSELPVLVDFWAPWCGPCKMIAPAVAELSAEFEGKIKVYKLNVDKSPRTAERYQIQSIPCLLLFKGGEVVDKSIGLKKKDDLEAMIKKHLD